MQIEKTIIIVNFINNYYNPEANLFQEPQLSFHGQLERGEDDFCVQVGSDDEQF